MSQEAERPPSPAEPAAEGGAAEPTNLAGDFLAGLVIFLIALYTLFDSTQMPFYGDAGVWGSPGLTPGLISAVLLVLSAMLMFRSRRVTFSAFGMSVSVDRMRGLATFALIVVYAFAIPIAGYVPATFVLLFVFQVAFSERHSLAGILIWGVGLSAVLTIILYYLFAEFFFIPLPRGPLGV